jgi:hypothetical protein
MELVVLFALIVGLFMAIASGNIASNKGRSFAGFFLLGLCAPVIGLIVALLVEPVKPDAHRPHASAIKTRECPHCYTNIDARATVCPQCSRDVPLPERLEISVSREVLALKTHRFEGDKCTLCGAKKDWITTNTFLCPKRQKQ